ncbi:MAG: hypothetical protein ACR2F2_11170 [Pyrinomonadaceae bacterium]
MNIAAKTILILIIAIAYTGCWGNATETNSTTVNNNSSIQGNSANTLTAANGETVQPVYNGEMKEIADGFPVPANADVTIVNTNQSRDTMREKPAPDDSTFSAEMNGKGQPVETRTFKSHPVLAKVEKITMSPRDYVFKIYLKNGKVVESKSDQLKDFRVISPINILDAIGMKPPPPKPDPNAPKPEDQKKPIMIPKANP